jgi:hypothetical protein
LWSNGIEQNAVCLAEALRGCPQMAGVVLVNATDVPATLAMPWNLARRPTVSSQAAKNTVDVLIELG